ncbi:hypothetical protein C8R46DRAFT_1362317 [Mycena filopes]|nr:hypothetical protein C8R46DRAFT_1362317 [Mycena filopes]
MPFLCSRYHAPSPSISACPCSINPQPCAPLFPFTPAPSAPTPSSTTATSVIHLFNCLKIFLLHRCIFFLVDALHTSAPQITPRLLWCLLRVYRAHLLSSLCCLHSIRLSQRNRPAKIDDVTIHLESLTFVLLTHFIPSSLSTPPTPSSTYCPASPRLRFSLRSQMVKRYAVVLPAGETLSVPNVTPPRLDVLTHLRFVVLDALPSSPWPVFSSASSPQNPISVPPRCRDPDSTCPPPPAAPLSHHVPLPPPPRLPIRPLRSRSLFSPRRHRSKFPYSSRPDAGRSDLSSSTGRTPGPPRSSSSSPSSPAPSPALLFASRHLGRRQDPPIERRLEPSCMRQDFKNVSTASNLLLHCSVTAPVLSHIGRLVPTDVLHPPSASLASSSWTTILRAFFHVLPRYRSLYSSLRPVVYILRARPPARRRLV